MNSITDITNAFYINLLSRPDRKQHVESQLNLLGITAERFNAIKLTNGALGCSLSHLKCLETAREKSWSHVLIVEDDIQFLKPALFKNQLNLFLSNHSAWDVVLLGGNNVPPYEKIDNTCIKVSTCQTTTGYLVNGHYFSTLIDNFRNGIKKLMSFPDQHRIYAIDKFWFQLQKQDNWFLITPLTVTQREDYSDIEKRATNYSNVMLDVDKVAFMQRQRDVSTLNQLGTFNF
jgi:GR25 family glycosyltransferase involved in LPS biosynthesis